MSPAPGREHGGIGKVSGHNRGKKREKRWKQLGIWQLLSKIPELAE
jgi:hypothetical protein